MKYLLRVQDTGCESPHPIFDEHEALMGQLGVIRTVTSTIPQDNKRVVLELEALFNISEHHFIHEEKIMLEKKYDNFLIHRRDHAYLLNTLRSFIEAADHRPEHITPEVGVNLLSWITFHIRKFDDAYLLWAAENAKSRSPEPSIFEN